MADGLVAGKSKAAKNVARGADQSFLNGSLHNFSGEMLRYFECTEPGELFVRPWPAVEKVLPRDRFPKIVFLS
jgi:hypothetical protein